MNRINLRSLTFLLFFIFGTIHWYLFLNFGDPTFKTFDWKHTYQVHDIIKQSVKELKIPYHVSMFDAPNIIPKDSKSIYEAENGSYDIRYLSSGNNHVSPHLILFIFFDIPTMMFLNILVFFSIGLWGILCWIKKFNLSIPASFFLFIIWSFNGFIVTRMGVGHLGSCSGYLVIPMFFWLLYRFIEKEKLKWQDHVINTILFSFFIFFVKLNANGINVYQMILVTSAFFLFYPKLWIWYFASMFLSFLLMIFYIIPTFLFSSYIGAGERVMEAGYGVSMINTGNLEMGIQKIIYHFYDIIWHIWRSLTVPYNAKFGDSWEWSLYVSYFGLFLLIIISFSFFKKNFKKFAVNNISIFYACCLIIVYSISSVARELHFFLSDYISMPLPDRRANRVIVYPLSVIFLISAISFDSTFNILHSKIRVFIKYLSIIVLTYYLITYSYNWFVFSVESNADLILENLDTRKNFKTNILDMPNDKTYINIINISYLISFVTFLISLFVFFYIKKNKVSKPTLL
tara:strand:- start:266 stop:1810 length:1545 start_codon:yes stop_codon:yes gene_type:complete